MVKRINVKEKQQQRRREIQQQRNKRGNRLGRRSVAVVFSVPSSHKRNRLGKFILSFGAVVSFSLFMCGGSFLFFSSSFISSGMIRFDTPPLSSSPSSQPQSQSPSSSEKGGRSTSTSTSDVDVIAYLSQGPAKRFKHLSQRFQALGSKAKFFYHSFDKDCHGCLFQPNTTLPMGRNIVLNASLHHQSLTSDSETGVKIKYFVFFDDDMELTCRDDENNSSLKSQQKKEEEDPQQQQRQQEHRCWLAYHQMLLNETTNHPFISPTDRNFPHLDYSFTPTNATVVYESCLDDNFWSIRYDYIDVLYPFTTYLDNRGWWLNAISRWHLLERCFPTSFLVEPKFTRNNPKHRPYPRARKLSMIHDILDRDYPQLGPWKQTSPKKVWLLCNHTLVKPTHDMDPVCRKYTQARFQKWVSGNYDP